MLKVLKIAVDGCFEPAKTFLSSLHPGIGWVFSIDMSLYKDSWYPHTQNCVACLVSYPSLDLPPVLPASHHSMQQVTTEDVWSTLLAWDVQANWRDGKITCFFISFEFLSKALMWCMRRLQRTQWWRRTGWDKDVCTAQLEVVWQSLNCFLLWSTRHSPTMNALWPCLNMFLYFCAWLTWKMCLYNPCFQRCKRHLVVAPNSGYAMGSVLRSHGVTMPTWSVWFSVLMRELWNLSTCILPRIMALHPFPPNRIIEAGSPALIKNTGFLSGGVSPKKCSPFNSEGFWLPRCAISNNCNTSSLGQHIHSFHMKNLPVWSQWLWHPVVPSFETWFFGWQKPCEIDEQLPGTCSKAWNVVLQPCNSYSVPATLERWSFVHPAVPRFFKDVGMWIKNVKRKEQGDKWATG